ncbi:MAG TPA: MgtC/SapB family protein [Gaiellaceae bacterium]|nr:MgtC/SapB family protein [Gaiellaceae bacterium]
MPEVGWDDVTLRLAVAAVLGGAIGLERELREREAGLRTHLLVAVGAAVFTLVSAYGFDEFRYGFESGITLDPTRIAAQIVTGIGFLGAGAIIRQGLSVRGLTTAATLWVVAAIGMAAGAGYYSAALVSTAIVLVSLWPLRILAYRAVVRIRPEEGRLLLQLPAGASAAPVLAELERSRIRVDSIELEDLEGQRNVIVALRAGAGERTSELLERLSALDEVDRVEWTP